MTKADFLQGWALLLAQPWAREYELNPQREAVQFGLYFQLFSHEDAATWLHTCRWWVEHEERWPIIPWLKPKIRERRPPRIALPEQNIHSPRGELTGPDFPTAAARDGLTLYEACTLAARDAWTPERGFAQSSLTHAAPQTSSNKVTTTGFIALC